MWQKNVLFADITSWVGISLGARHFYCTLSWYDSKTEIWNKETMYRTLTAEEARGYNKRDKSYPYKAGDTVEGFDTEEQIISEIIRYAEENKIPFKIILKGSSSYASVMEALWGPKEVVKAINTLFKENEEYCYCASNKYTYEMDIIDHKFYNILNSLL